MVHFIGIFFRVEFVGRVENEPLPGLEHGGEQIDVLLEGQFEVLGVDESSFPELLVSGQPTESV